MQIRILTRKQIHFEQSRLASAAEAIRASLTLARHLSRALRALGHAREYIQGTGRAIPPRDELLNEIDEILLRK